MSDTLSDVLRAVRLRGAVFFAVDATAPWVTETPAAPEIAPLIIPGADHLIDYHVVTSGSCWGGIVGEPAVRLEAGDIIVFPQGSAHVMSSAPGMRGVPDVSVYRRSEEQRPMTIRPDGGGRERAEVICGFLGCDARPFNPLIATLPRVIHVRGQADGDGVLGQLVKLAVSETAARRSGGETVLARLSELLFVEIIRRHLSTLPPEHKGWLAGLRDEQVGRALGKLHDRPEHPWSLEELARQSGLSRSALAERFASFVGVPPMQYLAQWRMQLAATLLSSTAMGLAELAGRVGYGSEAALSRAFQRWVGVAPALWRQGKRGEVQAETAADGAAADA
jgi:AraC-like DNA-binding protein